MKALFLALTLLVSGNALANNGSANVSQVNSFGGAGNITASGTGISLPNTIQTDLANSLNLFSITCGNVSFTNNLVNPCLKDGVAYQVANGKTAECSGILTVSNVTGQAQLLSDTAPITANSGTGALTAPVYQGGAANNYVLLHQTAGTAYSWGIVYNFAQNTYPGVQASLANNHMYVFMTCREK